MVTGNVAIKRSNGRNGSRPVDEPHSTIPAQSNEITNHALFNTLQKYHIPMKGLALILILILKSSLSAQTFSVNPVDAAKALYSHTSTSTKVRRFTMAFALAANGADWGMSRHFIQPGSGYCELNPVFQKPNGCDLNVPKLDAVKFGISLALFSEEGVHQFLRAKHLDRADQTAERIGTIINIPTAIIFTAVDIHNVKELK